MWEVPQASPFVNLYICDADATDTSRTCVSDESCAWQGWHFSAGTEISLGALPSVSGDYRLCLSDCKVLLAHVATLRKNARLSNDAHPFDLFSPIITDTSGLPFGYGFRFHVVGNDGPATPSPSTYDDSPHPTTAPSETIYIPPSPENQTEAALAYAASVNPSHFSFSSLSNAAAAAATAAAAAAQMPAAVITGAEQSDIWGASPQHLQPCDGANAVNVFAEDPWSEAL